MEASYQKQMIVNRIPLPRDVIDNEIKSYMFYDKISGETKKKKQILTQNFKENILSTRINFFGSQNELDPHWAVGFNNDEETLQLQGHSCERCGNYLLFGSMLSYTQSQLSKIICNCMQVEEPVEIMWDQQQEDVMHYESQSQSTQDTLIEDYDDEDIVQDTEWDQEYAGNNR